jgi:hypothetical protein
MHAVPLEPNCFGGEGFYLNWNFSVKYLGVVFNVSLLFTIALNVKKM